MSETYSKDYTISLLVADGANESWVKDVWSSFSRIAELPFSEVGFGYPIKEKAEWYLLQEPGKMPILSSFFTAYISLQKPVENTISHIIQIA